MTHDERFAEFQARREQERAAIVKVTWRKVSPMTGGGYSGLGPGGALVYAVLRPKGNSTCWEYGRRVGGKKQWEGDAVTLAEAKRKAAALLGATT